MTVAKASVRAGSKVSWAWGEGRGQGTVKEVIEKDVTRQIKGSDITRHGTPENPALLIEQEDGDTVLKLESEIERD
jgi:Hypervirulence associated proteins TUDOR domain